MGATLHRYAIDSPHKWRVWLIRARKHTEGLSCYAWTMLEKNGRRQRASTTAIGHRHTRAW